MKRLEQITTQQNVATLQALMQFALPLGTTLIAGEAETIISWAVTVRAQPPAFPDIHGGEMALVSMDVLWGYNSRITLAEVIQNLAEVGVGAVAVQDTIPQSMISVAEDVQMSILQIPLNLSLTSIERAVNKLIVNQSAQLTQRAIEVQRQLTQLVAENRGLSRMLQVIARATARPVIIHDNAGVTMAQMYPSVSHSKSHGSALVHSLSSSAFQKWVDRNKVESQTGIVKSPIGFTIVLWVEKRIAGYLSLVDSGDDLNEYETLILTYGGDVCAIELAKNRAIALAVEQVRGDWIQMWLSGSATGDDLLLIRAHQAGFATNSAYIVTVFRAMTEAGVTLPLGSLAHLIRDDIRRRQINAAVGQYVDVIIVLYLIEKNQDHKRLQIMVEDLRQQLAVRTPGGLVAAGISRPVTGLSNLREAYREARDALSMAYELGDLETSTYYGDLKLYQLLLILKEHHLEYMIRFFNEALHRVVEHDDRKNSELVRTLAGFFEANGNLAKAASDLDVHRNTLVYRLQRISELTGLDLNDAENRLILHLALKIQRVLATLPTNT